MEAKKNNKANLESKKSIFIEIGLILSLALMIAAFEWSSEAKPPNLIADVVDVPEDLGWNKRIELPETPPPPPAPTLNTSDILLITTDPLAGSGIPLFENYKDPVFETVYVPKANPIVIEKEVVETILEDPSLAQDPPKFLGGSYQSFPAWVQKNVVYPAIAIETDLDGKVYVRFKINKDGSISDAQVLRSATPILDQEAVKVVLSSPKWEPARQYNVPVAVMFTIPVVFKLQRQ